MVLLISDDCPKIRFAALLLVALVLWSNFFLLTGYANSTRASEGGLSVTAVPSSVVIRVGETVSINVTATSAETTSPIGQVCFSLEDFPDPGFRTSFLPECAPSQSNRAETILNVGVTAAAAPQTFTAFIVARSEGQSARTTLDVRVEPAFPPWIAWTGLVLFLLIIGLAITAKPKQAIQRIRRVFRRSTTNSGGGQLENLQYRARFLHNRAGMAA